jgi:MFS family permease
VERDELERGLPARISWLYAGIALGALGAGLGGPYLLAYLHEARRIPLVEVGGVLAVGSASALAGGIAFGSLGRRLPLRASVVTAMLGEAIGYGLVASADTVLLALLGVVVLYLAQGIFWVSEQTLIGSLVEGRALDHVFARVFLAINLGLGIASALGGLYLGTGPLVRYVLLYRAGALLEGAGALVVGMSLVGTVHGTARARALDGPTPRGGYVRLLRRNRALAWFLLLELGLLLAGYAQLEGGFSAFAIVEVGVHPGVLGFATSVNTAVIVLAQVPVSNRSRRWRRSRQLLAATLAWAVCWAIAAVALSVRHDARLASILLVVALGVFGLGETLYSPVAPALVNALASEDERPRANALSSSLWSVTSIVASPLAATVIALAPRYAWVGGVLVVALGLAIIEVWGFGRILPRELDAPTGPRP